jgi:hypothetical protein
MVLQASVWSNGGSGWGLKILGGSKIRSQHFDRSLGIVFLDLDGNLCSFNICKNSFWTKTCGELIGKELRSWISEHGLHSGQRIEIKILESKKVFRPLLSQSE